MKAMKKLASLLLALVMALALAVPAFAAGEYSITVKNEKKSVSINGNTYSAYKLFDVTYDGKGNFAYTVSSEFANFTYTVNNTDYKDDALIAYLATLNNDTDALDAFAKAALKYATDNKIAAAGLAEAQNETAVIELDKPGYYLVTGTATAPDNQTVTAACALTTAKPTAEVNVKADAPSVDKKIVEGEQKVAANTASIGDSVNYEITSKVPDMKGYAKYFFVMEDTLSKGLTYNEDMVIKIGDTTLTKDTDYTLKETNNADGTTSLEIVFKDFIQYKGQTGAKITVTYSATLNQDADLTRTGNPNEVKLIYSNNPNTAGTGEPSPDGPDKPGPNEPTGETPKSETKTYVTGIKITKVDKDGNKLTGAKFEISGTSMKVVLVNGTIYQKADDGTYYMLKDGTYTKDAPVTDKTATDYNADKYDSVTDKYKKVEVISTENREETFNATGYVDKNGVLTFEGLGEGTYTITEIVAPNGYNLLKEAITVKIEATEKTLNGCTWKVTVNDTEVTTKDNNLFAFNVENNAGTELPSTGGIGTTIFYVVGSVLVIGAAVVLITRKRMGKSDK